MELKRRIVWGVAVVVLGAMAACSAAHDSALPGATSGTAGPPSASSTSEHTPVTVDPAYAPGTHDLTFEVDGVARTAVVVVPIDLSHPAPLVFVFHGHGGNGHAMDNRIALEKEWPEAVVVYPDGLVGHKGITDPDGTKPGWQTTVGEAGDRDLAFYDVMLATLESKLPIDRDRIDVMGHSNGSQFASLLLNQRGDGQHGDSIAASANLSAAPGARLVDTDPVRSMFMAMGTNDPIVPFALQQQSVPVAEQHLGVDASNATVNGGVRSETGPGNIELEVYVYDGGHEPPVDVPRLVAEFFQRHALTDGVR